MPTVSKEASVETLAKNLEDMWQERVPNPEAVVGITVERGWRPKDEWDGKLNIADAIMDSGGLPKLLYVGDKSATEQIAEKGVTALALPGGRDVDPSKYGEKVREGMKDSELNPAFDDFQIEAAQYAFETGMPIVGHCRGHQVMNVAGGGTLTQDIPLEHKTPEGFGSKYDTKINHRPEYQRQDDAHRVDGAHLIYVEPGSRLHDVVGDSLEWTNSIHHQAADEISPLMDVVAYSMDGVVEASQRKGMPWQHSFQFHPETQRYTDSNYQLIYDKLVDDAKTFGEVQAETNRKSA